MTDQLKLKTNDKYEQIIIGFAYWRIHNDGVPFKTLVKKMRATRHEIN